MNSATFLRLIFGENLPGHILLWTRQNKKAYWLSSTNSLEIAGRLAAQLAVTDDVYFGGALQDRETAFARWRAENPGARGEPTTRGYSQTARAVPGLWADIDVQGPAHRTANLPPSKAAARMLVAQFPLPPTLVIDSEHGLQAKWLFRKLWVFDHEAERQAAQSLARRFLATLQANARAHGWQVDPTADLARLLRLPGTVNRKLQPVPVHVIEQRLDCRYNPSELIPHLVKEVPSENMSARHWHGPAGAVAPVLTHCRFIQHCGTTARTLSEPFWWAMVSNLVRLERGREAVHTLSGPYPQYSQRETEKKMTYARKGPGPHTCVYIQETLGFTGCPLGGCGVKTPAALGASWRATQRVEARQRLAAVRDQAREAFARLHAKQNEGR